MLITRKGTQEHITRGTGIRSKPAVARLALCLDLILSRTYDAPHLKCMATMFKSHELWISVCWNIYRCRTTLAPFIENEFRL